MQMMGPGAAKRVAAHFWGELHIKYRKLTMCNIGCLKPTDFWYWHERLCLYYLSCANSEDQLNITLRFSHRSKQQMYQLPSCSFAQVLVTFGREPEKQNTCKGLVLLNLNFTFSCFPLNVDALHLE